jgi:hypothetical protein
MPTLDICLTWGTSVLKGVMDVAQTVDWQNCKLPVVDTGLQSLGLCACGDQPYSIQAEEKNQGWSEQTFWCSGLLMLNEGDCIDLLVWNPFSLEELLQMQGGRSTAASCGRLLLQSTGSYNEYVLCLRE